MRRPLHNPRLALGMACLAALVAGAALPCVAWAQAQAQPEPAPDQSQTNAQPQPGTQPEPTYVPSLLNGQLINLSLLPNAVLVYGGSVSFNLDQSRLTGQPSFQQRLVTATPYVGITGNTESTSYALQYSPTILAYSSPTLPSTLYHSLTFTATKHLSPQWEWGFNLSGQYGDSLANQLGPMSYGAIGSVSTLNAEQALFNMGIGNIAGGSASTSLTYHASGTQSWSLTLSQSYFDFTPITLGGGLANLGAFSIAEKSNQSEGQLTYSNNITPKVSLGVFGNDYYMTSAFGTLPFGCNYFGGGLSLGVKASNSTTVSLSASPEYGPAKQCIFNLTFSASASASTHLNRTTTLYASANRSLQAASLGVGGWMNTAVAGVAKGLGPRTQLSVDGGVVQSNLYGVQGLYKAYLADASVSFRLAGNLALVASYRQLFGNIQPVYLHLSYATVSLQWDSLRGAATGARSSASYVPTL
jgi:hypothetical protein